MAASDDSTAQIGQISRRPAANVTKHDVSAELSNTGNSDGSKGADGFVNENMSSLATKYSDPSSCFFGGVPDEDDDNEVTYNGYCDDHDHCDGQGNGHDGSSDRSGDDRDDKDDEESDDDDDDDDVDDDEDEGEDDDDDNDDSSVEDLVAVRRTIAATVTESVIASPTSITIVRTAASTVSMEMETNFV